MTLKGSWDKDTTYEVGDVVRFGIDVYHLQKEAPAGTQPVDTLYWGKLSQDKAEIVIMMLGMIEGITNSIPTNISDDAIVLNGSESNQYIVTIDDSGDTPEVIATLIEGEE